MSESSKMGLFGSKDETKETKKESKDNSPDRYAPYCIDSDSETYDTEALSIMDINDIIGVQSEPVSDSTLESEIAALSQMITESKPDGGFNTIGSKFNKMQEKCDGKLDTVITGEHGDMASMSDKINDTKVASMEFKKISVVKTSDNMELDNELVKQEDLSASDQNEYNDVKEHSKSNILKGNVLKNIECPNVLTKVNAHCNQTAGGSTSVTFKIGKCEKNVNKFRVSEEITNTGGTTAAISERTVFGNEQSISGSLQLIGEAYSSDDSQESIVNSEELKDVNLVHSSNEDSIPCKEGNDTSLNDKSVQDVNRVPDHCSGKDIEDTPSEEISTFQLELSNMNQLPVRTEDAKDVLDKTSSSSNITLEIKKEDTNTSTSKGDITESILEENKINVPIIEETEIVASNENKIDGHDEESTAVAFDTRNKEWKGEEIEKSMETVKDERTEECVNIGKESTHESNNPAIKVQLISEGGDKDIDAPGAEIDIDNSKEVSVEKDMLVESIQPIVESRNIDDPPVQETDHDEKQQTKPGESSSNQLSPKTNEQTSVASNEIHTLSRGNIVTALLETDCLKADVQAEDMEKLDSVSTEVAKDKMKDSIVESDTTQPFINQGKSENSSKSPTSIHPDTTIQSELVLDTEQNVELTISTTESTQVIDKTMLTDFTVEKDTEGNIDQSLKNNDEKPEEMEVEYMDTSEYESKLSEKMVNVNEDDITIKENEEEAGIQEQMETKSTIKEPTEKIAIVEKEADDNVKIKDQTKDETIVEESTNDMAVIEEPKGSKIVEEDLRNSTDVDEEQTCITIMIDQVAKEKDIVKEAVNDDAMVDIQTETNVRITEEMETNITDQEDIQAVCKINDPSEPIIGETIEDKSIAEEPTQETMIIKQIVEDVDMKEEPPENRVVIEEPTEKSSVIEEFSDNKTALEESIENVLEIKETTEVSIVEKTIEDDAAVEEVTGYKISVEEPMKDNIDNEESSKDKVTVEDSIKDKVIVEELAVIDVTIELPKVEDAVKDKIVVEKPTEEKPFIKEPEKDTIIAEEVVQDRVAMQNPVQHEMIKENPVEDTIIAEEPEKDKIAIEEPTENAIVMEESVEDTIVIEESTKATVIIEEPMECISTSEDSIEDQVISDEPREDKIITDEPSKDLVLGNEVKEDKDIPDELMEEKGIVEESTERSSDIPVEEAIEVDSRIVESMDKQGISEEPTNIEMVTKEQIEEEHVNPTETKETIAVEEQKEEDEDEDMDRFNLEEKQLIEMKDDIKETEDNKRSCTMTTKSSLEESDEKIVSVEEIINHANENVSSHLFSSSSENVVLAKNDMKDKYMEEEMNLSMEPEKIETLLQVNKNDIVESPKTEKAMDLSEEDTSVHKRSLESSEINDDIPESLDVNAEESVSMEVNEIESIEPSNDSELRNKQLLENSLKEEPDKETLKDIVENVNSVEGIFSEQSQNTQDIVTSILDDVNNESDFKHVLNTESGVVSEIEEVLQQSETVPLIESEMVELTEKLPQDSEDILSKDIEDTISNQNVDSLEGLLGLDLIPEGDDSTLKSTKTVEVNSKSEQLENVVDVSLLLEANHSSDMKQPADYKTHVISDCLTDRNSMSLKQEDDPMKTKDDEVNQSESDDMLKIDEVIIPNDEEREEDKDELRKNLKIDLPGNELDMDFDDTQLESVDSIEETEPKLELTTDILLHNAQQSDNLNDIASGVETSQPSSEISELESAVKFLQESEEQAIDSPLVLSPKMVESVVDDMSKDTVASSLFVCDEQICENTTELEAELQSIETDSISISEAEIISEAAKLESERKLAEQIKIDTSSNNFKMDDQREEENKEIIGEKILVTTVPESKFTAENLQNLVMQQTPNLKLEKVSETISSLPQKVLKTSELIPKVSILEERLKEPPKIEIPFTDITKISMSPTTSKDSLLIQKDVKLIAYQKMLESPKLLDKSEPKIVETPRKDSEKHDFENVGSPRIILKIAKSAITDCGEPRSPKSPKIRSATNSPNPEDSPGQKLGKIKLKLSKSGHPSIISNENIEEIGQWYSESSSSLSPLGMKIKLSKSGDASIVSSEKYETPDDLKEGKRTESPIGMKIKLSKFGDASIVQQDNKELQMKHKDKLEMVQGSPKRTESPIGMKFKLSKSGDASIIQPERQDILEEYKDNSSVKLKEKNETCYDSPKRTDSPIGMKIKLSKTGDASIVSPDMPDETKESCKSKEKFESSPEILKRTESPIGMKIKLTKTKSGASIISVENSEEAKEKLDIPDIPKRTESPLGMKIKLSKSGDASIVHSELSEDIKEKIEAVQDTIKLPELSSGMKIKVIRPGEMQESVEDSIENVQEPVPKVESPLGMKIKLSKFGDASIVPHEKLEQTDEHKPLPETPRRTESPLGMKIKLSKTGDASIIQSETSEEANKGIRAVETEHSKPADGTLGMKIKLLKTGDASIVDSEKKDRQQRRREAENPLEMKIKISKTGHPTIVACENAEGGYKPKDSTESSGNFPNKYKESGQSSVKEPALKLLKSGVSSILQSNRSELTIEPIQMQAKKAESVLEIPPKRKDVTISPVEPKKTKLEAQLTQMILPEVTIQPVASREQKQFLFDPKSNSISLQQMNVINQEISITQVRPQKPVDASMSEKLKDILSKNVSTSALSSDCEIIEHRPDLIIVNDNSNSSQDVMIIEELPTSRMPEVKIPKKRGRPRRNPLPQGIPHGHMLIPKDPLALDNLPTMQRPQVPQFVENERPKRTCRSQKSYAPPKRGRGRGRGKRKLDSMDPQIIKKPRIEQDLSAIETSTTGVLTIHDSTMQQSTFGRSPELYKALKQPAMDARIPNTATGVVSASHSIIKTPEVRLQTANKSVSGDSDSAVRDKKLEITSDKVRKVLAKDERTGENIKLENKDMPVPSVHANWLTPVLKRSSEGAIKHENVSTVQVIDEETRMSAESGSRSQTPARNISAPASETIVNEESQGSVLSTATTESEKVKVKNRRMEINFDPDEGPFTVEKIVEYEWPLDRKGETFMIQEQISQYLGVKSFKRKYPDLKRRVVDREERNYLRENGLVSEAMCDMGLTAICSSEVLDVMCSDFTDQYEEYRKHMREKQVKEHSKKQKELTAAATAEKNRIDLAEMAVQSALSWNISLNKARRENRKCSLDLQTFTIHVPKKQQKVDTERRIGHYPVALIPGQYTDYYREYTPAELRYYPLNTVLYGPMRPNERKLDSQSEGSQSDSDTDSSSDDSSSSSSEGTQDTEGSQSTMDEVDMDISHQKDEIKLKCKMCLKSLNKNCKNEVLIQCGTCNGHVHPSCIDLTLDMVPHIQSYAWQCTDCKTCAQCHDPADEDKMLFCDMCDRGYHIYCVGLRRVPQGRWHCQECAVCANCGSREPGGVNSDRNSVAQWQHEYKKGDKNTRVYVSTLCVPCSKLWRKGRYCPHCSRCHNASRLDLEPHLVHCSACDKYLHLGCVETKGVLLDRKNYLCDFCTLNHHHQLMKPFASKTMKT